MKQAWRWFGPSDIVPLSWIAQAGASGVVSACHQFDPGEVWTDNAISQRKVEIQDEGLEWSVIESLPVSEAIKTGGQDREAHIAAYILSLKAIARCNGPSVVCYNFMPILDWTRTNTDHELVHGGTTMAFSLLDFAAFDLHILKRPGADAEYDDVILGEAKKRFDRMSSADSKKLLSTIVSGLPGANDGHSREDVLDLLKTYENIGRDELRANLSYFLKSVVPVAEELGLRLCAHPDDPPFSLLGLPRILSCEEDYQFLIDAVPSDANGITFCSGSLGVIASNDLCSFVKRYAKKIHFVHLRNTSRSGSETRPDFIEDAHLDGDTDMISVLRLLLQEEKERRAQGREDFEIPMRPDHGQRLLGDLSMPSQPGYPAVGRLRGLAELRGAIAALESS